MFCPSCGKEVFAGDRFCKHCGAAQTDEARTPGPYPSAPPRTTGQAAVARSSPKGRRFWRLHTFDWLGECPVCHLTHNPQNANCPNDGSPLVVAFDARKENPLAFPVHTAELRCSSDCGFSTQAIACNDDGVIISESNLTFRLGLARTVLHNVYYLTRFLISLAILLFSLAAIVYFGWRASRETDIYTIVIYLFIASILGYGLTDTRSRGLLFDSFRKVYVNWWPFRRTFRFDQLGRDAKLRQAVESREEAAKTAQFVDRRAEKPQPKPPNPANSGGANS